MVVAETSVAHLLHIHTMISVIILDKLLPLTFSYTRMENKSLPNLSLMCYSKCGSPLFVGEETFLKHLSQSVLHACQKVDVRALGVISFEATWQRVLHTKKRGPRGISLLRRTQKRKKKSIYFYYCCTGFDLLVRASERGTVNISRVMAWTATWRSEAIKERTDTLSNFATNMKSWETLCTFFFFRHTFVCLRRQQRGRCRDWDQRLSLLFSVLKLSV